MLSLEQRYRLLMRFYPPSYRQDNEGEMLSTLVDVAAPGQIDPSLREGAALAVGGLRARSRLAVARGWGIVWADSLRLTALVLLGSVASDFALFAVSGGDLLLRLRVVPVLLALAMVATVRGASRVALFLVGAALLDGWRFLAPEWQQPDLPVTMHLQYTTMALAAAVCALTWHGLRGGVRTPWSWWAAAVAVAVPGVFLAAPPWEIAFRLGSVVGFHIPLSAIELVLPVGVLVVFSFMGRDPRPAVAAVLYSALSLVAVAPAGSGIIHLALLSVLVVGSVATCAVSGLRLRRIASAM